MTKYRVTNIKRGLLSDAPEFEAKSPMDASRRAGYVNVRRIFDNHSWEVNLVVQALSGGNVGCMYLYHGDELQEGRCCK